MNCITWNDINQLQRTQSRKSRKGAMLCKILKSGKPGKPILFEFYGCEATAQDVIDRLEKLNPETKWIAAE